MDVAHLVSPGSCRPGGCELIVAGPVEARAALGAAFARLPAAGAARSPLIVLLGVGALLFAGATTWRPAPEPASPRVITVTGADLDAIAAGGLDAWVDEEILYREGAARGFARAPGAIARLLQLGRSLGYEAAEDEDLLGEVTGLALDRSDPVLRAQVAGKMRLLLANESLVREPTDAELEPVLEALEPRFAQPARVSFRHVFLSRDRRGAALARDAEIVSRRVRTDAPPDVALGDPFPRGDRFVAKTHRELEAMFGAAFAVRVAQLPEREWSEPIPSAYGVHLVRVSERQAAGPPDLAAVRSQLRALWRRQQADQALAARLSELRSVYELRFAPGVRPRSEAAQDRG